MSAQSPNNSKKLNIGVFLSAAPSDGGVYQYSLSILHAVLALDPERFNLRLFVLEPSCGDSVPERFVKIQIKKRFHNRLMGYAITQAFRNSAAWRFASYFSDAARAINSSDCDVVIYPAQDGPAYQTNKKAIATIHDLMHRYESHYSEYRGREAKNRDVHFSAMCEYADLILVDSRVGKAQVLESYGVLEKKVQPLPYVPPYSLLSSIQVDLRARYGLPEKFVFYPAQFWEHKNHVALLQALKLLKDQGDTVNLVLVGSRKNNYSSVLAAIDAYKLTDLVLILGYVSDDELFSLYKTAVAMVYVSAIGPTNIPPMEALITGCPLVCSNKYGMAEQVGRGALLVNPHDPIEIADAIRLVWYSDEVREQLRNEGLKQAGKYSQTDFTRILHGYIGQVIGEF